ncbi:MAG TPA: RluA family pseudouridine synthase [Polyangiaceae bacterium]|nr:RluA family pseudouridine synthase [Polyangiaceae bacterium]
MRRSVPPISPDQTFVVPADLGGRPLDGALKALTQLSWGDARKLIERGKVAVGDKVVTKLERRVREGETIEIRLRAPRPTGGPVLERSVILYLDTHVVVVNKPAGVSTVPYEERERGTLAQLVAAMLPRARGKGPPETLGVVQRLDKETSGVLVFARTFSAKKVLGNQLRKRAMHRRYLAIAHGQVEARDFKSYLVKNRGDRLRGTSKLDRDGQLAITHVKPLETLKGATLVECRLETGRTHQIRIHLAEAGHPIVGERVYVRDFSGDRIPAPRPMLHAAELGFVHPSRDELVRFESPLPADFEATLARLRGK